MACEQFQNGKAVGLNVKAGMLGLVLVALTPPFLAVHHPIAALVVRSFFGRLCHQLPGRSLFMEGSPVAVCVRCLGIYCGAALAAWISLKAETVRWLLASALLLNLLDVCAEKAHWYGNVPLSRLCLGVWLGFGIGAVLLSAAVPGESIPQEQDVAAF